MLEQNEIQFPHLGIDLHVDSTAFQIFGIDIQWYGLLITCGLLLAMLYAFHNMRSYGIHPDRAIDAIIGGIIGAIVGARAYYVILEWDNYAGDWKRIFNLRQGGLAIYGGLIGALVVGCIIAKIRKVRLLPLLDLCGAGFLLGARNRTLGKLLQSRSIRLQHKLDFRHDWRNDSELDYQCLSHNHLLSELREDYGRCNTSTPLLFI